LVPGEDHRRKGRLPDSLGLQHPSGRRAGPQLFDAGIRLPDEWRLVADNARRGLVIHLPIEYETSIAVEWLLNTAPVLTPGDLPDDWIAEIHPG
jgi:hypothetical protein